MRYFLLIFSIFLFQLVLAQSSHRLKIVSHKKHTAEEKKFVEFCLSNKYGDDLLPDYAGLDTVKHISALIRAKPAIHFDGDCNGIYYYLLRSEYWPTPTLSGTNGAFYEYEYLVLLNEKAIPFKANDPANSAKFAGIRKDLIKYIGVQKTDSIKQHLIRGYAQL
ncbi:hypothetical protein MON38_15700 [Hymenobacter sp. DH14]|uniref:Uncharacterized protein n=1 Tax=Hymenobacter cyanobacteriorum TaxID=2926463 RepID=A0A9X1VIL1_9BACT|nr:hypothetical protein [Hymenobacter cyanobacteriorum]MCI1188868.1 hypothetical protein [Hymenobacter cyanobacteriorum]